MATPNRSFYKRINGVSCVNYGYAHQDKAKAQMIAKELRANNPNMKVSVTKETAGATKGMYQIYIGADK